MNIKVKDKIMNIKEYVKKYNLELSEQEIEKIDKLVSAYLVWKKENKPDENKREGDKFEEQIEKIDKVVRQFENKTERLPTLGFGIPNLLKSEKVGYFPEQFLVELGLQGMTALEIKRLFMSADINGDGDIITCTYSNTRYFVDFKNNVFIKQC